MKFQHILALSFTTMLLAACKPSTESADPSVAGSAPEPVEEAGLPVRYSEIKLSELDSAGALTALCESENATMREHLGALEAFAGKPTVDVYYRSLDSLAVSRTKPQRRPPRSGIADGG